jgi:triacylglycerol lipase
MLQCVLLAGLAIEFGAYLLLGILAWRRGFHPALIPLCILIIPVALRILATLPSYALSTFFRWRDGNRLPWGNSLRAFASEVDVRAFTLSVLEPFHPWLMAVEPLGPKTGMPILLVHGYVSNRGMFWRLQKRLAAAALGPVHTISLRPLFGSIDEMVPTLAARIEAICAECGAAQIVVVAHSMGGLVTRAYLLAHPQAAPGGTARIARLITLGSPHQGTRMAAFGIGRCVREMRPGSPQMRALAAAEASRPKPPTLSIYTLNDDLVYPPESSCLDWAENVPMSGIGHVGLLNARKVAERVIDELHQPLGQA